MEKVGDELGCGAGRGREKGKVDESKRRGGKRSMDNNGGRNDRHSKVWTARGTRDRRVRLSPRTAIMFYDVQERLGYDRPSKAIDWLLKEAKASIDALHHPPPAATATATPTDAISGFDFCSGGGGGGGEEQLLGAHRFLSWNYGEDVHVYAHSHREPLQSTYSSLLNSPCFHSNQDLHLPLATFKQDNHISSSALPSFLQHFQN